jgi:hypothetical protein
MLPVMPVRPRNRRSGSNHHPERRERLPSTGRIGSRRSHSSKARSRAGACRHPGEQRRASSLRRTTVASTPVTFAFPRERASSNSGVSKEQRGAGVRTVAVAYEGAQAPPRADRDERARSLPGVRVRSGRGRARASAARGGILPAGPPRRERCTARGAAC